ncbi:toprim domain-containing protein [Mesorhizobium sp. AR07]|uniref:toprim domain-containing protein n=1 Tax=Mesorhizobium sp. AR07 TaxID=2865838 RepID=UPI00215F3978|nr:toprim domain-containing protein [Mesorhizobium sp. AR07]UVK43275.1 toprim domain-containing protein [Mesorhizobium sp. AR07]
MQREPLKTRAEGRWFSILSAIGIPSKSLKNKHGPCPICGGKDRFRFDDKGGRGTFFCSHCGAGDGIELVKLFRGLDFKEAAVEIEKYIGAAPIMAPGNRQPATDDQKRNEMTSLWKRSKPISLDDHAGRYLHRRTGLVEFPSSLRFTEDERYVDAGAKPSWHPAMVAKVDPSDQAAAQGERAAIHRTYLDKFGGKADVLAPRKMLGAMPTGAAVRLMPHQDTLGIAEGIETALSASVLYNMPVWAALTAGLLQEWTPPASVETVFIFGDNDASSTGQAAAYSLCQRLKAKGLSAFVELPPVVGQDWNDVLLRHGKDGRTS